MKKFIVFANTMKKLIVGKHYEKIHRFLGSALISRRPSVRNFYSRVKKKTIEGPAVDPIQMGDTIHRYITCYYTVHI